MLLVWIMHEEHLVHLDRKSAGFFYDQLAPCGSKSSIHKHHGKRRIPVSFMIEISLFVCHVVPSETRIIVICFLFFEFLYNLNSKGRNRKRASENLFSTVIIIIRNIHSSTIIAARLLLLVPVPPGRCKRQPPQQPQPQPPQKSLPSNKGVVCSRVCGVVE